MAVSPLPNPFSIDNNRFLLTILPSKDVSVPKFILEKGTCAPALECIVFKLCIKPSID